MITPEAFPKRPLHQNSLITSFPKIDPKARTASDKSCLTANMRKRFFVSWGVMSRMHVEVYLTAISNRLLLNG